MIASLALLLFTPSAGVSPIGMLVAVNFAQPTVTFNSVTGTIGPNNLNIAVAAESPVVAYHAPPVVSGAAVNVAVGFSSPFITYYAQPPAAPADGNIAVNMGSPSVTFTPVGGPATGPVWTIHEPLPSSIIIVAG